jgi:hypothetical protein
MFLAGSDRKATLYVVGEGLFHQCPHMSLRPVLNASLQQLFFRSIELLLPALQDEFQREEETRREYCSFCKTTPCYGRADMKHTNEIRPAFLSSPASERRQTISRPAGKRENGYRI